MRRTWLSRRLTQAVALALAALALACSSDEAKRDKAVAAAEALIAQGEAQRGLLELRNALKLDPQNARINFRIAEVFESSGQFQDALFYYSEAHRLDPKFAEAILREAALLLYDDPGRASELIETAATIAPDDAFLFVLRSRLALLADNLEDALRFGLAARELAPRDQRVQLQLGRVHQARIKQAQLENKTPEDALFRAALDALDRARDGDDQLVRFSAEGDRVRVLSAWPGHELEAKEALKGRVAGAQQASDQVALGWALDETESFGRATKDPELVRYALEERVKAFPDQVDAWWRLSIEAAAAGGSAEAVLKRMIEATPKSAAAHVRFAQLLVRDQSADAAIAHLQTVVDSTDNAPLVARALATLLRRQGRDEEAKALIARVEAAHPDHPGLLLARAEQAITSGDLTTAEQILVKLSGTVQRADVELKLAEVSLRLGRANAALAASQRAIDMARGGAFPERAMHMRAQAQALLGDCPAVLRSIGSLSNNGAALLPPERALQARCLASTGHLDLARSVLSNLEKQFGNAPWLALEIANIEAGQDPKRALAAVERALADHADMPGLQARAAALEADAGHSESALARLNALTGEVRDHPVVRLQRARLLAGAGQSEAAEADALAAFEADPSLPGAASLLVDLYTRSGRTAEAIASFEQAAKQGTLPGAGKLLLANLQQRAGNGARARELLEELVEGESASAAAKNDLAYLLASSKQDLDRALRLATEAKRDLPSIAAVSDTLGYVQLQRGLLEPALSEFRMAIQLSDASEVALPLYHLHAGLALEGLGKRDEAVSALREALARDDELSEAREALQRLGAEPDAKSAPADKRAS